MDEHEQKGEGRGTAGEEQTRREAGRWTDRQADKQKTERQAETAARRAHKGRGKEVSGERAAFPGWLPGCVVQRGLHEDGQVGPHWVRAQLQRAKGQQAHPVCLFVYCRANWLASWPAGGRSLADGRWHDRRAGVAVVVAVDGGQTAWMAWHEPADDETAGYTNTLGGLLTRRTA
ncbi:uncharacterized protein ARB_00944 [Trichophyton benhamiae CBS 112371]|uniref:Uncharacterized protein n=1 Tax=Arthroderma benhamiae (strain ATCC MYA-4681 / CBS 112371) TaxID=663331 RepID=D4AXM5_ARTBC|nr:uncharacterized protein ARB_00944 [Trichophyton benhamiae CBS 112371]EFE32053.1 hypothetical protein ARB_00944 [Trichophyton benhamiae CBS 112371]